MKQAQNRIETSIFSFSYESKNLASRCNNIIESIFNSKIVPELELTINKKLHKDINIELDTLVIDIGSINEKELESTLAQRVKKYFEQELHTKLSIKNDTSVGNTAIAYANDYLLAALEAFLLRGYLPSWLEKSTSLNELLLNLIDQQRNDLILMLRKYRRNDSIMKRLSFNLESGVFERLIYTINRVNYQWIINFRNKLSAIENKEMASKFERKWSHQMINFFILIFLLDMPSNSFNKRKFVEAVLSYYISKFSIESNVLLGAVKSTVDRSEVSVLMIESLQENQQNELNISNSNNRLGLKQIIADINKIDSPFNSQNAIWYREQMIDFIKNERTRAILLDSLNDRGIFRILEQFYQKDTKELMNFITSFVYEFKKENTNRPLKSFQSAQGLMLISVLYRGEKSYKKLDFNDFFLFLVSKLGIRKDSSTNNASIKRFVQHQHHLNKSILTKFLVKNEELIQRKASAEPVLKMLDEQIEIQDKLYTEPNISLEAIDTYRKIIILYYLDFGHLPKEFKGLNQIDIQNLFTELIQLKDPFLVDKFRMVQNPTTFYNRISFLISENNWQVLNDYLSHYFSDAVKFLVNIVFEFKKEFEQEITRNLNFQAFNKEVIIKSLIASKGKHNPSLLLFLVSNSLLERLSSHSTVSNHWAEYLKLQISGFTSKGNSSTLNIKNSASHLEIHRVIESDIFKLIQLLSSHNIDKTHPDQNYISQINKLVHYLLVYPEDFKSVIAQNQIDFTRIIILIRLHLSDVTWQLFEKTLSPHIELKNKLIQFHEKAGDIFVALKTKTFNIANELKKLKSTNTVRTKTILSLILREKEYFDKFYKAYKNKEVDLLSYNEPKIFQHYLMALMNFVPKSLSRDFTYDFWQKLVLSFIIQLKIGNKHMLLQDFSRAFKKHVYRELKAINKEELYYKLVFELSISKSKSLTALFGPYNNSIKENSVVAKGLENGKKERISEQVNFQSLEGLSAKSQNEMLESIYQNKKTLENFIAYLGAKPIPSFFIDGPKINRDVLLALYNYSPEVLSESTTLIYWKSLILRFAIQLKLERKTHTESTFKKAFIQYCNQEIISIDTAELFNVIIDEMKKSKNEVLRKWSIAFQRIEKSRVFSPVNENYLADDSLFKNEDIKSSAYRDLTILAFYAHNEFFPWWTDTKSLAELMNTILDQSQSLGKSFEDLFLEIEAENKFIEPLISKSPTNIIKVLSLISSRHSRLNRKWKKSFSNVKPFKKGSDASPDEIIKKYPPNSVVNGKNFDNDNYLESKQLQKAIYFLKDEEILERWLNKDAAKKDQILAYLKLSPYLYFQDINPSKWRKLVYTFAFDYYKSKQDKINQEFHKSFINYLIQHHNIPWKDVFKAIYKKSQIEKTKNENMFPNGLLPFIGVQPLKNKILNKESRENTYDEVLADTATEIRIYNSGLILIWPFVTRFFEQLALLKNGQFVNEESRNRAVYLLQYLIYNRIDFPEYELVLNKLFVGMPLQDHLSPIVELTKVETDLAKSLLNGLIINWEKVKDASIEAIQETFLRRDGLLRINEKNTKLIIKKKGVDVLLESLSWNISIVKLPWMKQTVFVEWT